MFPPKMDREIKSSADQAAAGFTSSHGNPLTPCATTKSMFLYVEKNRVVLRYHNRRPIQDFFEKHVADIQLLVVNEELDDTGTKQLVFSYDVAGNGYIWDLYTKEVESSLNRITAAAWTKNGALIYGTSDGCLMIYGKVPEDWPGRIICSNGITAISVLPSCNIVALGFENGETGIAALDPEFRRLRTIPIRSALTPCAVIGLSWHHQLRKCGCHLLACQTQDGSVRVLAHTWCEREDAPKIVRQPLEEGRRIVNPEWMAWCNQDCMIQYSDSRLKLWDIRKGKVTRMNVLLPHGVRGFASHGPETIIYTLGPRDSVHKVYDSLNGVPACETE